MTQLPENYQLVLFDGVCNLCSSSVQFIIERDKKGIFKFASLQSDIGQQYLQQAQLPATQLQTLLLVANNQIYTHSDAALRIARSLDGSWQWLYGLVIVPGFIRNAVYNFVAANRYKWFGKKNACWIPTPELKNRFIE